jgi:hypothetical protein
MRTPMFAFALGAVALVVGCDTIGDIRRAEALRRFDAICHENAGLIVDRAVGQGGVKTDLALGETLWLLFDFGAPHVESEFRPSSFASLLFEEWNPPAAGAWTLHAERVPRGDLACDVFDAWRLRLEADEQRRTEGSDGPDYVNSVLPSQWRSADRYQNQCLKLTFLSPDQIAAIDSVSPQARWQRTRYQLTSEQTGHAFTGPWFIDERRYALVDSTAERAFTVTALRAISVPIDAPNVELASCGDPIREDLSADGRWFEIDELSDGGRFELAQESARLRRTFGRNLD